MRALVFATLTAVIKKVVSEVVFNGYSQVEMGVNQLKYLINKEFFHRLRFVFIYSVFTQSWVWSHLSPSLPLSLSHSLPNSMNRIVFTLPFSRYILCAYCIFLFKLISSRIEDLVKHSEMLLLVINVITKNDIKSKFLQNTIIKTQENSYEKYLFYCRAQRY